MEENQNVNADINQQNPEKKVQLIHNPLPGPKPHVKKQMTYDYTVPEDQMHFDVEHPEKNYYDYE